MIPATAFKQRLEGAKATGRKEMTAQLDKDAQDLGYASHTAMMEHLRGGHTQSRPQQGARPSGNPTNGQPQEQHAPPPSPPTKGADRKVWAKYENDRKTWDRKERQYQTDVATANRRARNAERKVQAMEARTNLERIASSAGIRGDRLGQAIYLFEERHRGMSVEQLGQIDEAKFFEALRPNDPYLFGEAVIPATTGTTGPTPGSRTPPKPSATSAAAAEASSKSVMDMTEAEFAQHQRQHGIRRVLTGLG